MKSVAKCMTYTQWAVAVAMVVVTYRCINIVVKDISSFEGSIDWGHTLEKVKNHIFALVIAVCVESIIQFIKGYLF